MKTAIATVSISGDLREKLSAIAKAGFDGIEIFENDFLAFDGSAREVGAMVRDFGLEVSLFQPFRDFEGMPVPLRERGFERAERKFELMGEMGAKLVLVCSNTSPLALGGIDLAAEDLNELGERAAKHGIRIGYEALAWGRHVNDHRCAWEIVRLADHANVGLILDSFHTLARNVNPETIRSIPGDRIFFVQLADAPQIDMDLLHWSRHFRCMPGEGDLDVQGFMRAVGATGYDGVVSLEIFNDQFRGSSSQIIASDGYRSLLNLMHQVKKDTPSIAISVPKFPDRAVVKGIEFIEFTVNKEEAQNLGELLRTLGFSRRGRHIAKDVTLWCQGGIKLLLNTDLEGFARSSYLMHGPSVCDIGIRVDDADAVVKRAHALGGIPFHQKVGSGEIKIPAIHAGGAGLLHFFDDQSVSTDFWEIEFSKDVTPLPLEECGLSHVDHIALTMKNDEMLSSVLFYTSLIQAQKLPTFDVVDPDGLVRSQVIENDEGSFRITLNGAENARTLAGRFNNESFGSAVQHLAFATDDIFATLDALSCKGFVPLAISQNYYDDLDARLGLDESLLENIRNYNILYDCDQNGEYFQAYSEIYNEGFFFEILERRGNYKGYGAANAYFRVAAQKRRMAPKGMPKF